MMLAWPTATAVTNPCAETVATALLSELQPTLRPISVPPLASNVVDDARDVPTAVIEVGESETVTEATGASATVIDEVPLLASLVAVIAAVPCATAVTN